MFLQIPKFTPIQCYTCVTNNVANGISIRDRWRKKLFEVYPLLNIPTSVDDEVFYPGGL